MNDYLTTVWGMLKNPLLVLALLTLIDFVMGVVVALIKKKFQWVYLYHYLETDVLPIFAWVGVVLISAIPKELLPAGVVLPFIQTAVYATVFLSILASILQSFSEAGILTSQLAKIGVGPEYPPKSPTG